MDKESLTKVYRYIMDRPVVLAAISIGLIILGAALV